MKTCPLTPPPRRLSPLYWRNPNTSHSPLCYGNLDTFLHNVAAATPALPTHPHLGPERVSLLYFTDHVVGALSPLCPRFNIFHNRRVQA